MDDGPDSKRENGIWLMERVEDLSRKTYTEQQSAFNPVDLQFEARRKRKCSATLFQKLRVINEKELCESWNVTMLLSSLPKQYYTSITASEGTREKDVTFAFGQHGIHFVKNKK